MVTKQQQLAWLAKHWDEWVSPARIVFMSKVILGGFTSMSSYAHEITKEEWQQERDHGSRRGFEMDYKFLHSCAHYTGVA